MRPEDFEIYCQNIQCGDTVVHPGTFSQLATKQHRRLQYIGILDDPPGLTVHQYICPVCAKKRVFSNSGNGLEELQTTEYEKLRDIAGIAGLVGGIFEADRKHKSARLKELEGRPIRRFLYKIYAWLF